MTEILCKKCNKLHNYTGQNESGELATCPKCGHRNRIPAMIIATLILASLMFGTAYAYEETVDIPRADYWDIRTYIQILDGSSDWKFTVDFFYNETGVLVLNGTNTNYQLNPEDDKAIARILEQIDLLLVETILLNETDSSSMATEPEPLPQTPEQAERARILIELDNCYYGLESEYSAAFGAIQPSGAIPNYGNVTRESFPERDNLNRDQPLLKLLMAVQECDIMKKAIKEGVIGIREANMAMEDLIIQEDYYGRSTAQENFGLDETRHTEGFDISEEDIQDSAEQWLDWKCQEAQKALKLCPEEFHGTNRGGYTDGLECQTLGQPSSKGGDAPLTRCPMQEMAAYLADDISTEELWAEIYKAQCDAYEIQYAHLAYDKKPIWIQHCSQ